MVSLVAVPVLDLLDLAVSVFFSGTPSLRNSSAFVHGDAQACGASPP